MVWISVCDELNSANLNDAIRLGWEHDPSFKVVNYRDVPVLLDFLRRQLDVADRVAFGYELAFHVETASCRSASGQDHVICKVGAAVCGLRTNTIVSIVEQELFDVSGVTAEIFDAFRDRGIGHPFQRRPCISPSTRRIVEDFPTLHGAAVCRPCLPYLIGRDIQCAI